MYRQRDSCFVFLTENHWIPELEGTHKDHQVRLQGPQHHQYENPNAAEPEQGYLGIAPSDLAHTGLVEVITAS